MLRRLSMLLLIAVTLTTFAHEAKIAIDIDDLGNNIAYAEQVAMLPKAVTCAIMPFRPFAKQTADLCHEYGHQVIVHVPMQADDDADMGAGGLSLNLSKARMQKTLLADLADIPYRIGMNNHMGSRLTSNQRAMNIVMETIKPLHIFFLDSMTASTSVAEKTALHDGIPTASRDVFLDDRLSTAYINQQFQQLLRIARTYGSAIAIGHPHAVTLDYLALMLKNLPDLHVKLVPLTELLHHPKPNYLS